jgi:serine protease Do
MSRTSVALLCVTTLIAGIALGARGEWELLSRRVQADGAEAASTQRIYEELRGNNPLQAGSELLAKIAKVTLNTVVHIQSERKTAKRGVVEETGSGVIVEADRARGLYVVTNRHVVDGAALDNISISLSDGRVLRPEQVWSDKETDVAVLKINANNVPVARWGDSNKVEIGHMVLAMGSPFGLSQSLTYGIISAKGRRSLKLGESSEIEVINQDFLQTDAAINPGNSGGPLANLQGLIIGINTAIATNSGGNEGIGFSIPSNLVRKVMNELLAKGKVTRAYLGVKLDSDFNAATIQRLKLDRVRGARVVEVYKDTPAQRSGLKFDDVVVSFDGVEVQDENHLINLVSLSDVSRKIKVVLFREGKYMTIEVEVDDRSQFEQRAQADPYKPGEGVRMETIGLTVHQLDSNLAGQLGYQKTMQGVLILSIDKDSPLHGDVQQYDLIEEVARQPVKSVDEFQNALKASENNDSVSIRVRRNKGGKLQSQIVIMHR